MKFTVRKIKAKSDIECVVIKCLSLQREKLLVLFAIVAFTNGYKEEPKEYEQESVRHIDYEKDQMAVKIAEGEGSAKVKRMAPQSVMPLEYESESVKHIDYEDNQTPAEDRNWQVKPKAKRMSSQKSHKSGKKIHIYLNNDEPKQQKQRKQAPSSTTTSSTTTNQATESTHKATETQTRKTPELTTKSDKDVRHIRYSDKNNIAAGSSHKTKHADAPNDSQNDGSDNFEHILKEKIKIKHHHHHHHHNHVKTVVKKEPYPVEKVVHVPYEKIVEKVVEKKVPYKVEVPVEKIVEKVERNS